MTGVQTCALPISARVSTAAPNRPARRAERRVSDGRSNAAGRAGRAGAGVRRGWVRMVWGLSALHSADHGALGEVLLGEGERGEQREVISNIFYFLYIVFYCFRIYQRNDNGKQKRY